MGKQAQLLITPFVQQTRERNLFLTLQEQVTTGGLTKNWHFPPVSRPADGHAPSSNQPLINRAGVYTKRLPHLEMVICQSGDGRTDEMILDGLQTLPMTEFPFTSSDLHRSGDLIINFHFGFLAPGQYRWELYRVNFR